jgi:hypothetical protein
VGGEREDGRVNESALREFVASLSGTQFSCFACTEVQILTQKALSDRRQSFLDIYGGGGGGGSQVCVYIYMYTHTDMHAFFRREKVKILARTTFIRAR